MSTLLTTSSNNRPTGAGTGDMYYETDTNKIILYDGSTWREFYSDIETSIDETINITYDSIDSIQAGSNYGLGDLFFIDGVPCSGIIKFAGASTDNHSFTLVDATGKTLSPRTRKTSTIYDYDYLIDPDNWNTPNWSGSTNLKNLIESSGNFQDSLVCTVSGDNNEYLHIGFKNATDMGDAKIYVASSHSATYGEVGTFNGGYPATFIIHTTDNTFYSLQDFN